MYIIDTKSNVPIYEQLKKRTLELIMAEILCPGDKIPSVRSLAQQLGINPNTIQKAYQDMEKDGIIYTISGKGSFVAEQTVKNEISLKSAIDRLFKAAYEARLYGVSLETSITTLKKAFEEE